MQAHEHVETRAAAAPERADGRADPDASWQFRVLYDGDCPLCSREIRFLEKRDRGRGRLQFEDIAAPGFDAGAYGSNLHDLMARIHGVLPDGSLVEGVEVFRRAYTAVGLGWLVVPTRWPGIRTLVDLAYRVFARNRLRWTGRECPCDVHRSGSGDTDTHATVGDVRIGPGR